MVGVPGSSPGVSTILELSYKTNYRYYSLMNKLLESFLRSDHAGEVGAVYIYKGILSIAKDPALVEFSKRHLETEKEHLRKIEEVLPTSKRRQVSWHLESCWLSSRFFSFSLWPQNSFCNNRSS